jgi:UPF0755 protein
MKAKRIRYIAALVMATAMIFSGWFYFNVLASNTSFGEKSVIVFIHEPTDITAWVNGEDGKKIIGNTSSFLTTAGLKKFKTMKPGRYRIQKDASNNALINMFRSGAQEPLSVRTDDVETISELAGKLGKQLITDSAGFMTIFTNDEIIGAMGFNSYTLPAMLVPNTYEFFWTLTPEEYLKKMKGIYDSYWTEDRIRQAQRIGLSPVEAATLASIVKAETAKTDEAPKIAGLYLNRLKSGIALQSDPTAVFGRKTHASRVYLNDLQNDSPYNTYQRTGLPPGPINFPEKIFLEAVLGAEKHDYIYMCAQPEATGYHNFSKTLDQHNIYRKQYTSWLERKGIR